MTDNPTPVRIPSALLNFGSEVAIIPIACALWGASCVQLFLYVLRQSSKDSRLLKITVLWTWYLIPKNPYVRLMNTAHMIAALYGFYMLTAKHWGDVIYVGTLNLGYVTLVSSPVQLIFGHRLWLNSPCDCSTHSYDCPVIKGTHQQIKLYILWSSEKMLEKLAVLTINTGIWSALSSLLTMILKRKLVALPENPAFTAAYLNSRNYFKGGYNVSQDRIFEPAFPPTQTSREGVISDNIELSPRLGG
ncbi:hypothetical protein K435DRAFT_801292 [Dendrothele bispora CBS 962.96]|uniref:Uncharacterized protein n=1 Tax=Dendrothele bispora (strain CBS 962.96) TaxID=1314807 RepID=A0A4S8LPY7_DENBC|nr:hypothetical protein K435DRAFT_801292 [Dendrothele bispora CBS 962.96]